MLVGGEIAASTASTFTVCCGTRTARQLPLVCRGKEKNCVAHSVISPSCMYVLREEAALLLYIQIAFYVTCKTGIS